MFSLPKKLTCFTSESYRRVFLKIEEFRKLVQAGEAVEISLSSSDINSLCSIYYNQFLHLPATRRAKFWLSYFEINDGQIVEERIIYPLWFLPCFKLHYERMLSFTLKDDVFFERSAMIAVNGMEISEQARSYSENMLDGYFSLISLILGSEKMRRLTLDYIEGTVDLETIFEERDKEKADLRLIISCLEKIEIHDNYLIIKANSSTL